MRRRFLAHTTVFAAAAVLLVAAFPSGAAPEDKVPSISAVMKACFKTPGYSKQCAEAGKQKDWDAAQKASKQLAECAANLPKTKCPEGDPASWEKLSKKFAEDAAAVKMAADGKFETTYNDALKTLSGSCKACHTAHRAKK